MDDRPSIEITGDTVDEAISQGLTQLGVGPFDVIVEVLEEPSRGVFGIGARQAKVRLQLLRRPVPPPPPVTTPATPVAPAAPERTDTGRSDTGRNRQEPKTRERDNRQEDRGGASRRDRPGPAAAGGDKPPRGGQPSTRSDRSKSRQNASDEFEYNDEEEAFAFSELQGDAAGEDGDTSRQVLVELLRYMGVQAEVVVSRAAASQPDENPPWLLNVDGRDVSGLIGRRGETLAALQYITRLIASRRLGRRANIVVDAGNYKMRRAQKLRELAVRMADQAVREARTVVLEPMPPHERRMIHMALRHREDVTTKSTGEGEARKVTIVPNLQMHY